MSSASSELNFSYPNKFIRAGAGAGKTTRLISTFVDFVQKFKNAHQRYPKVILTTFTRKSTQEIKERLLKEALKIQDADLFAYINKKSSVHISTIHGVLGLFLNQYQNLIGLSSDFKVLDKEQIRKQNFKELKSILKKEPKYIELLEHYSFRDLLIHLDSAFEFSNQQSHQNLHSEINFINAEDLKKIRQIEFSRIIALVETLCELPTPSGKGWSEYFDLLNKISKALQNNNLNVALEIFDNLPSKPRFSKEKPPFDVDLHEELQKYFKPDKGLLCQLDSDEYIFENDRVNKLFFELLNIFSEKIKESRRRRNEITISDLETLTFEIIKKSKTSALQFASDFDYFMIDEFQDTSPTQLNILNEFISHKPHFIVGDPQQSIYLFRGARSEVFLSKQHQAQIENYENIRLNVNYRSRPSLMKFMNQFFSDFSKEFEPMEPKPQTEDLRNLFLDGYFIQTNNEAHAALNHIRKLLSLGAKASDICVLSKKNSTLMLLSQTAAQFNVPVQLMVAAGFDERREILDLVSFVRFLVNPFDTENLIQLLRSPWFQMTDNEIVKLRQNTDSKLKNHFWLQLKSSNHRDSLELQKYISSYQKQGILQTTIEFIDSVGMLLSAYYLDSSGKKEANIWKFIQSLRDQINQKNFHLNEYLSFQFSNLQNDLGSSLAEAQPVISPDRVSLMTIHNAKGLQFEHVIVLGIKDQPNTTNSMPLSKDEISRKINLGIFSAEDSQIQNSFWGQKIRQQFNGREQAESERVLYVAMTRAITSVALIAEDKKKNNKSTWFEKSAWPELGEFKNDQYSYQSVRDDDEPQVLSRLDIESYKVVEPYQAVIASEILSESSIEAPESYKNEGYKNIIQNLDKAKIGTDLHRFFEALKYNSVEQVQSLATIEKYKIYLNFLIQQNEIPLVQILKNGYVEWGFGLQIDSKLIQRQIDAWGVVDQTVYILDYKTGSSEYLNKAYEQLYFYAACLKEIKKISIDQKIILGVIYPVEEKVFKKEVSFKDLKLT